MDMLGQLKTDENVGVLNDKEWEKIQSKKTDNTNKKTTNFVVPPLDEFLNVFDFESIAIGHQLNKGGLAYISTGAGDEITLRENYLAFHRIWLRPRICVNVFEIDTSTTLLGYKTDIPIMIAPTALAKLACDEGEIAYAKAAYEYRVIQVVPTLSSCTHNDIFNAKKSDQIMFYQLYVNPNREKTKRIVEYVTKRGAKALFITVDAPQLGRREKDIRLKIAAGTANVIRKKVKKMNKGTSNYLSSFIDPSLCWKDVDEISNWSDLPIVIKGIQTWEDAILAAEYGANAIVVSNHGGRQLDFGRSGIEILPEVMSSLKKHNIVKMEVYVDGGIKRGVDVFKSLALGANGVLIGRPIIYSAACHGQKGIEHLFNILKNELSHTMMLCGATNLKKISKNMVDAKNLNNHYVPVPRNMLVEQIYIPLSRL